MRSRVQFNAGKFLQAIPMTQNFQCSSLVFKIMLQLQMGRKISGTEGIQQCALCGAHRDSSFKTARHPLTTCKKGKRVIAHDKLRDIIHKMYQELGIGAEKEVRGLFSQLTSDGDHRPADVLVPPSATGGGLHWALDVTITDPTNKTNLERHSDTRALAAATRVHNKKLEIFRRQLEAAGPAGLQFEKKPLAFEATGAMGKETQEWWKGVVKLATERQRHHVQEQQTWTANGFSSYYLQLISMTLARTNAESVVSWIGRSQQPGEADGFQSRETIHV